MKKIIATLGLVGLLTACGGSSNGPQDYDTGIEPDAQIADTYRPDTTSDAGVDGIVEPDMQLPDAYVPDTQVPDTMPKEKPVIGACSTLGGPGDYVKATCVRAAPVKPNGNETLFKVVNTNLPAGTWYIIQPSGEFQSTEAIPSSYNISNLSLEIGLCEDENSNGTLEAAETNCDTKTINNF